MPALLWCAIPNVISLSLFRLIRQCIETNKHTDRVTTDLFPNTGKEDPYIYKK